MKKVAIIGSGIAGLSCAYFLRNDFVIKIFEKNNYIGGHANTVKIKKQKLTKISGKSAKEDLIVDTGFIVYNDHTYPLFKRFLAELGAETGDSDMSFSARIEADGIEYAGGRLGQLFAKKSLLLNFRWWRFLFNLKKFFADLPHESQNSEWENYSIYEYLQRKGYHEDIFKWHINPMLSSVWSSIFDKAKDFPAMTFLKFWENHKFYGMGKGYKWKTISNGSHEYIKKLPKSVLSRVFLNSKIKSVIDAGGKKKIIFADHNHNADGNGELFDLVIFACHADQAITLQEKISPLEKNLLGTVGYQKNSVILHTFDNVMPKNRKLWSSWNFQLDKSDKSYVHYWMNSLQKFIGDDINIFLSLNAEGKISPDKVLWQNCYRHPIFSQKSLYAKSDLQKINYRKNINAYYCGSYLYNGFHEDSIRSSYNLAKILLKKDPWHA